jgi:chitinase
MFRSLFAERLLSTSILLMAAASAAGCSGVSDNSPVAEEAVGQTTQALSAGRVIAYVDGTVGTISTAGLDANKYTHINYAFANLDANGNVYFTYPAQDTTNLNNIKALRNINPNLKVLVSVGGWTWSNNFSIVAGDANKRTTMVNSIWALVNNNGLDGIDIDWEWPGWQGEGDNAVCAGTCDGDRIVTLMQAIWNARGSKLVTMAGGAHPNMGAFVNLGALSNYVHFLNIMTYDFHGPWEPAYAPHANLYGGDISVDGAVNMYLNEGFPANKLVVGIPFYGKAWGMSDPSPLYKNISCSSLAAGASCSVNGIGGHTLRYDTAKQAAYIDGAGHYISYDNLTSVGWKTAYINNRNLGGAMYWSALQDNASRDLTNKIWADIGATSAPTRRFVGRGSGKCIDVSQASTADRAAIQLYTCNNTNAQNFRMESLGNGNFSLVNVNSGKCIDIDNFGTADGTYVQQYTCNRSAAQSFRSQDAGNGYSYLINTNSNKCLDVNAYGTGDGSKIHLWTCGNNQSNQTWRIE